ncbi:uncharacterized protein [Onthophagus taurus]|uniref:uncharacterized protein n=1 Tax=Onthophagus taurus TaxID=166361 RepID=UPI0039BDB36D
MIASLLILNILVVASYGQGLNICPPHGTHYIPHPRMFGKFLECREGIGYEKSCPEGLLYNANNKFCYDPEHLKTAFVSIHTKAMSRHYDCPGCHQKPPCSNGNGCHPKPPCSNGNGCHPKPPCSNGNGCHPKPPCENGCNSCNNECGPVIPLKCSGYPGYPGYPGYGFPVGTCPVCDGVCHEKLADYQDCTVYYVCDHGCAVWHRCPKGTYFNINSKECELNKSWNERNTIAQ